MPAKKPRTCWDVLIKPGPGCIHGGGGDSTGDRPTDFVDSLAVNREIIADRISFSNKYLRRRIQFFRDEQSCQEPYVRRTITTGADARIIGIRSTNKAHFSRSPTKIHTSARLFQNWGSLPI